MIGIGIGIGFGGRAALARRRNYIEVGVTNVPASTALAVTVSSGTSTFEFWANGVLENSYNTNSPNHTWTSSVDRKVRFYPPDNDFARVTGTLDWRVKNLTGPIDENFGLLTNLVTLRFNVNQLTGVIPSELGNMTNMQNLQITANQLTGSIPPELGNLTNLQVLSLRGNQLTGNIPSELGNLTNLQNYQVWGNQLTGIATPWNVSSATTNFRADANQLTNPAHINEILVRFDAAGAVNGTLNISGGTNAAPDGTSGGFDGVTAKANLIGKGWTVTTN